MWRDRIEAIIVCSCQRCCYSFFGFCSFGLSFGFFFLLRLYLLLERQLVYLWYLNWIDLFIRWIAAQSFRFD